MERTTKLAGLAVCLSAGLLFLVGGCNTKTPMSAQSAGSAKAVSGVDLPDPSAWGLQVASVNNVADTNSSVFQETFKLINFATAPRDASEVFAVVYFDVPQGDPNQVSFVNSTFASVFNANGTPTGVNSPVVLTSAGLFGPCINQGTGQVITSNFGFTVQAGTIIPPGGFMTFTPELWRGGHFPFNDNKDWTVQIGNPAFHFDAFIDLKETGLGNVTNVCRFQAPGVPDFVLDHCADRAEVCSNLP